jgi:hypothetical protein
MGELLNLAAAWEASAENAASQADSEYLRTYAHTMRLCARQLRECLAGTPAFSMADRFDDPDVKAAMESTQLDTL